MTVSEILSSALGLVSQDGYWSKGALCEPRDGHVSVCAMGAIAIADGSLEASVDKVPGLRGYRYTRVRTTLNYDVDGYLDRMGYDPEYDGAPSDVAPTSISDLEGEFPPGMLTPEGEKAACLLSAAIKDDSMTGHIDGDFMTCQSRIINFNDSEDSTAKKVVNAFRRALERAETLDI